MYYSNLFHSNRTNLRKLYQLINEATNSESSKQEIIEIKHDNINTVVWIL